MANSESPLSSRLRGRGLPRRVELLLLAAFLFLGCFAEPKPEASATGAGATGGMSGSAGTGGTQTTSAGGKHTSAGGSASDTQNTAGFDDSGGRQPDSGGTSGTGNTGNQQQGTSSFKCDNAVAQPLPARKAVTSEDAPPPAPPPSVITIDKQKLYTTFGQYCGTSACHVGSGDANAQPPSIFKVTLDTFDQRKTLGDDAVTHVTSSDPTAWMPPTEGDGSQRQKGNPYYDLAALLKTWQDAHFPASFTIPADSGGGTQPSDNERPYLLSPDLGKTLTNIGSCVPENLTNGAIMQDPLVQEMQQKDELFAGLKTSDDLPDTILETDLVTLASTELARRRVFSYAPTYPLFSDNAGKMRYVRVPLGETIHYDDKLHDFTIPDNTRFYKTFLKQVKDKDGNIGWRKMETRLIVVRQDSQNSDGSYTTHALRASYAWDKDEQMAHRVKDPFRDGTPARDRLCPYVVDESVTRDPTKNPISDQISDTCEYMTQAEMNDPKSGQIRHYAIPSTQRCDQCHMGSSSHSFILGFTPWQVDRRKSGEGGVYENPKDDELTQLQRFLDYGIVDGVDPGQVKLEESQLIADPPRSPRNDYELKAQGYMLGNCAFCHNPHGYPVVTNPVLQEFELFPSETGGVFQFPLERFSPRAKNGAAQSHLRPYITPAFGNLGLIGDSKDSSDAEQKRVPQDPSDSPINDLTAFPSPPDVTIGSGSEAGIYYFNFLGPWRSLIWRNVYTPFTYSDDYTIFIHMPRNAPGYDCRVQQIMAQWMLSIPAVDKPDTTADQPMIEISATDPTARYAYAQAALLAKQRVAAYAGSITGNWCPADDDIVDPQVLLSPVDPVSGRKLQSSPVDEPITGARIDSKNQYASQLKDGVPDHAHWVPTDTSDPPGKWIPRRSDWESVIATRETPVSDSLNQVIDDLQNVHLTQELSDFALEPLPMGLWDSACVHAPIVQASPTVKDLAADSNLPLRRWLTENVVVGNKPPVSTDHVHSQSRGEAVFHAICQNCHGKAIDSKSALAATISELTGGQTRVANFLGGLFGPESAPGAYARDEFAIGYGATPSDWQARYVLFMGLGGTLANIPLPVLNLVASSGFYGTPILAPGADNPNMLGSAQRLCLAVLAVERTLPKAGSGVTPAPSVSGSLGSGATFVGSTGHFELWESLCAYQNEPVVHVFLQHPGAGDADSIFDAQKSYSAYRAKDESGNWVYPPDAPVGNQLGQIELGIQPSNLSPWCVRADDDTQRQAVEDWAQALKLAAVPICPSALLATTLGGVQVNNLVTDRTTPDPYLPANADFVDRWTRHGAMTAGLSAFHHMRGLAYGDVQPSQAFDFCVQ